MRDGTIEVEHPKQLRKSTCCLVASWEGVDFYPTSIVIDGATLTVNYIGVHQDKQYEGVAQGPFGSTLNVAPLGKLIVSDMSFANNYMVTFDLYNPEEMPTVPTVLKTPPQYHRLNSDGTTEQIELTDELGHDGKLLLWLARDMYRYRIDSSEMLEKIVNLTFNNPNNALVELIERQGGASNNAVIDGDTESLDPLMEKGDDSEAFISQLNSVVGSNLPTSDVRKQSPSERIDDIEDVDTKEYLVNDEVDVHSKENDVAQIDVLLKEIDVMQAKQSIKRRTNVRNKGNLIEEVDLRFEKMGNGIILVTFDPLVGNAKPTPFYQSNSRQWPTLTVGGKVFTYNTNHCRSYFPDGEVQMKALLERLFGGEDVFTKE